MANLNYCLVADCGCCHSVISGDQPMREIAKWMTQHANDVDKRGYKVEQHDDEWVRANFYSVCPHKPRQTSMFRD